MASLFTPLLAASALILSSCGVGDQAPQPDTSNPPPQTRSSERQQTFSQAELEELVAPIALYSDPLLARVLMASSNPLELVEASRWVKQNKHLKGSELLAAAEKQRWVYSVKQLTATPSVLIMMSDKLDWTRKLQHAVIVQEPDVLDAVLRVRAVAQAAQDTLNPTDEQKVARLTEDNKDVGIVAQAPQPDISNPPPQTESGEGQEQRVRAVAQAAQDTLNPHEQKVARLTEDNKDVGTVAQAPQPDISNPPPQTEPGEGQEQRVRAVAQATQDTLNPHEQKVARLTGDNKDVGTVAQAPQPDISNPPPPTEPGEGQEQRVRAVAQAAQDTLNPTDEQKVARLTEDNKDVGTGAQASQPDAANPSQTQSGEISSQTQLGETQKTFSQAGLDQLVAPIALYPDALLARVFMASTYPDEVVEASRWVDDNQSLQSSELKAAAEKQRWDYSVKQLTATPSVLAMMSDKLNWTEKLGDAVLAQQADLMDAVQRLRTIAQSHGKLKTTEEQKVSLRREGSRDAAVIAATNPTDKQKELRRSEGSRDAIVIEPTNAETIYVPYYDSAVVYGEWPYPDHPPLHWPEYYSGPVPVTAGIAFAAFGVGAWMAQDQGWGGDFDWHRRHIHHRRGFNDNYRDATRWAHNPDHRRSVRYKNPDVAEKFDRNRGSRASRTISRNNEGVADRDQRDYRANVHNRGGSDRKAATQKRASNKQVKSADRSKKRLVQDRAPRRSDLGAASERQTRMQANRDRASQMRMPADLDRRSFAADRSIERAMIRGFFGGGVQREMRGFGGRRR